MKTLTAAASLGQNGQNSVTEKFAPETMVTPSKRGISSLSPADIPNGYDYSAAKEASVEAAVRSRDETGNFKQIIIYTLRRTSSKTLNKRHDCITL
jgi:hypothetical protein